jgi:hypothetical protein
MSKLVAISILTYLISACDLTGDINTSKVKGYNFSLFEVQKYCMVKRQGDKHLSLECKQANLKPVTQGCEGQITGGLADVEFNCSGGLWVLSDQCKIKMYGADEGGLKCRI